MSKMMKKVYIRICGMLALNFFVFVFLLNAEETFTFSNLKPLILMQEFFDCKGTFPAQNHTTYTAIEEKRKS